MSTLYLALIKGLGFILFNSINLQRQSDSN